MCTTGMNIMNSTNIIVLLKRNENREKNKAAYRDTLLNGMKFY